MDFRDSRSGNIDVTGWLTRSNTLLDLVDHAVRRCVQLEEREIEKILSSIVLVAQFISVVAKECAASPGEDLDKLDGLAGLATGATRMRAVAQKMVEVSQCEGAAVWVN